MDSLSTVGGQSDPLRFTELPNEDLVPIVSRLSYKDARSLGYAIPEINQRISDLWFGYFREDELPAKQWVVRKQQNRQYIVNLHSELLNWISREWLEGLWEGWLSKATPVTNRSGRNLMTGKIDLGAALHKLAVPCRTDYDNPYLQLRALAEAIEPILGSEAFIERDIFGRPMEPDSLPLTPLCRYLLKSWLSLLPRSDRLWPGDRLLGNQLLKKALRVGDLLLFELVTRVFKGLFISTERLTEMCERNWAMPVFTAPCRPDQQGGATVNYDVGRPFAASVLADAIKHSSFKTVDWIIREHLAKEEVVWWIAGWYPGRWWDPEKKLPCVDEENPFLQACLLGHRDLCRQMYEIFLQVYFVYKDDDRVLKTLRKGRTLAEQNGHADVVEFLSEAILIISEAPVMGAGPA